MPAYNVDWSDYNKYKATGGSFKDYTKKEYSPFGDAAILNHFSGEETIGIYPLFEDNTSYFIAADFDEKNWKEAILKLHQTVALLAEQEEIQISSPKLLLLKKNAMKPFFGLYVAFYSSRIVVISVFNFGR